MDVVEEIARVFADTPARVIDFLSMARGQDYETEQSVELMSTLLHSDEKIAEKLARRIERIESTEQAYRRAKFIEESRRGTGAKGEVSEEEIRDFEFAEALLESTQKSK
jgi:hypothetical protein